jgi:hypothetical protein
VFYKGFTRAYLDGETDSSEVMLDRVATAVDEISLGKAFTLIDGVGYPSVGSICNLSNAHVARHLGVPVVLVGKSGVGDAVDAHNLNAAYFENFGVKILGCIFNKLSLTGYYSLGACKEAVSLYFKRFRPHQEVYGFVPVVDIDPELKDNSDDPDSAETLSDIFGENFKEHVDVFSLVQDAKALSLYTLPREIFLYTRAKTNAVCYADMLEVYLSTQGPGHGPGVGVGGGVGGFSPPLSPVSGPYEQHPPISPLSPIDSGPKTPPSGTGASASASVGISARERIEAAARSQGATGG